MSQNAMKLQTLLCNWKQYKYRFVPWLAYNWRRNGKTVRRIAKSEDSSTEQDVAIIEKFESLFHALWVAEEESRSTDDAFYKESGFQIKRKKSLIKDAGSGVFVTEGCISEGTIAAMYPGTIYEPSDPLLIQSISNPFILRCIDGILIDGNDKGISKYIYRSCCGRDMIGPHLPCDTSWLSGIQRNPLAIGQYINNQTHTSRANVVYQEVDVPISFPLRLRKYLPNIHFRNKFLEEENYNEETRTFLRVVVLMSLRKIEESEELLSAYFTEVH